MRQTARPIVTICAWTLSLWSLQNEVANAAEAVSATESRIAHSVGDHEIESRAARLLVESCWPIDAPILLRGIDAAAQLAVTLAEDSKPPLDVTRKVRFQAEPAGIVAIDDTGYVVPLADGRAVLTVELEPNGLTAELAVVVEGMADIPQVNFPNQVVPIFTRHECNSGGCHGKAAGQNGFRLSLLGFEPGDDYEYLVKESRGRRLSPAAPDESLLLRKATGAAPHGGGPRLTADSYEYRLLRRWIAQGMPYGEESDPSITRIELRRDRQIMPRLGEQQLVAIAHYSNGSVQDITRFAQYEANDAEMAAVSDSGLVTTRDLSGDVAVMVRYQGHVAVFQATLPLGAAIASKPAARTYIDELVFQKLDELGVPASRVCDDGEFIRRATLDIAGRLPTSFETREFLSDTSDDKRDRLIDRLLDSPDYAEYFANKWNAILRNKRLVNALDRRDDDGDLYGNYAFRDWIRDSLYVNKPYDQFVREILTATGDMRENPPVAWYRSVADTEQRVEDTAQLFLGQRIQCARCHHHPFEKWSQRDYYALAAFFSRVGKKDGQVDKEDRVFHKRGQAVAIHPRTSERVFPAGLNSPAVTLSSDDDPRHALVDWMAAADNPYFATALVNRYWKHFFSRGLVEPEDDLRVTNPPTNPALLAALANDFIASSFDLKRLIRTICRSSVYQLSSSPTAENAADRKNFARYYPKRLTAEVLCDAIDATLGANSTFAGLPTGTRAVQLPDTGGGEYFLSVFGRPSNTSACECERAVDANLAQSLHLLNSIEVQSKLGDSHGRAAELAQDTARDDDAKLRELYLLALSREPTDDELRAAISHVARQSDKRAAFEDVLWALVNTKEFLFNH